MTGEERDRAAQKTPKQAADVERVGTLTRLTDGRQYSLGFGSLRVGRQKRADLVITDKTVSRHHADVCYEGGRYVLYDHSTNGTWINGTLVAVAQPLRNGDTIKFGKVEFRFNLIEVPADEAAARAGELTAPKRISGSSTFIMKGGKGKRRTGRMVLRALLYVVLLLIVAAVVIYFLLPDVAASIISGLPPGLQEMLGAQP
ncbi:MAG: FHA domain-containing protein [Gemmatimonadota bacterium]|nr:MAG: FHA domain-containing protein [Gemmatimonadota bacterium]